MNTLGNRHEVEARLLRKLGADPEFREASEANPTAMLSKAMGIPENQAPSVVLHQEAPGEWHIVMPRPTNIATELSDADLEHVDGGTISFNTIAITAADW